METVDWWYHERAMRGEGYDVICGVDEAGRGCLAGPVCAAAVILPFGVEIEGLNDSKKLTEKKREGLFDVIVRRAVSYGIGWASVEEIERYNILRATYLAMNRAIAGLSVKPDIALIDGNQNAGITYPSRCLVDGDALSASVAAASVLAKVSRDRLMRRLDLEHPQYGFAANKGYGTPAHREAILTVGACPLHRTSFLKKILSKAAG
ncbi:MAG: ribonuclease HII [Clostridiales bacterium]|nr:ribonuclease HII [Clostridiales bacterium]